MLEDVSESSMDSVILQDDMTDRCLSPLYTTQNSGIVVVNDGSVVFSEAERRVSSRCISPVSLLQTQPGERSVSVLSSPLLVSFHPQFSRCG